ncbi:hypothetical protein HDV01_005206 [Terramyces sp. JEL0728]|nr:hypothetical protein HDV01_005206 [Terramyces sp. JEL0728]
MHNIYLLPYVPPSEETTGYFKQLMRNPRASSDVFSHICKAINDNVKRFLALQITLNEDESIITNPVIKAMKMKAEKFIRILDENISEAKLSNAFLISLNHLVERILAIFDPDPFSGLHDACRNLQFNLSRVEPKSTFEEPPKLQATVITSPLMQMLTKKKNEKQERNIFKTDDKNITEIQRFASDMSVFALGEQLNTGIADEESKESLLLEIKNVWIEVDPILNRVIENNGSEFQDLGVFASDFGGKFQLTTTEILWYGVPLALTSRAIELEQHEIWDLCIQIQLKNIKHFYFQAISPDLKFIGAKNDFTNSNFLTIYTKSEVYRLFPFYTNQMNFIKTALEVCAGVQSTYAEYFLRDIITDKIERERQHNLELLMKTNTTCIENSEGIFACLSRLTDEKLRPDPKDLELLFHSCRLESAVTNETIILIQVIKCD